MGINATIIAATVLATKALTKPPKMPEVDPPPTPDEAGNADAASAAGQRARRRAIGASGRSDTILTGAQGLGGVQPETGQAKTLLGL
jgi:hypothetical protein